MAALFLSSATSTETWTPTTGMSAADKEYGLIEPKTGKKLTVRDVFNNDSDSGGEQDSKWSKKSFQKEEKGMKKQTKIEMQRALQEDPTVYQYDEIYDEMTQKKQELEQTKVNPEKKAKYIHNLMKTAEKRKKENERRLERQVQKEREAEGDMYKDKEEFITSSYKAKLEEFKKAEEEERKMEYIESVMDVTKQQDLGGFYRHLYKETVAEPNATEQKLFDEKEEAHENDADKSSEPAKQHERNYRKRHNSDSNDGEEKKTKQDSSSSSSDSDSSSDSSSSSSSSEEEKNETKEPETKQNETKSGPEDGEIIEGNEKSKKEEEKPKIVSKNEKSENKTESRDDRSRNVSRNTKPDERDRRDRNYRSSGYDRDRSRNQRRDDRSYRDRDRDRERERERERRMDRKLRDRGERRSSDSRRKRSKTPERRRNRSRERSSERSRSRRGKDVKDVKNGNVINDIEDEEKKKEVKEVKKEEIKETEEKKEVQEETNVSIWEKRTVGAVFEAALERYKQRKASRSL